MILEEKSSAVKRPNTSDSEGSAASLRTLDLDDSGFMNNSCSTQVWDSNTIQR